MTVLTRPVTAAERRRILEEYTRIVLTRHPLHAPIGWCLFCDGELPPRHKKFCSERCTLAYWEVHRP